MHILYLHSISKTARALCTLTLLPIFEITNRTKVTVLLMWSWICKWDSKKGIMQDIALWGKQLRLRHERCRTRFHSTFRYFPSITEDSVPPCANFFARVHQKLMYLLSSPHANKGEQLTKEKHTMKSKACSKLLSWSGKYFNYLSRFSCTLLESSNTSIPIQHLGQ